MTLDRKPESTAGDVAHLVAKAGLSAIPIVGGPAAEIFAAVVTPPLVSRRDAWVQSIGSGLMDLTRRVGALELELLADNQIFVTTALHATQIAIKNHQKEKIEALRNVVLNAAIAKDADEDLLLLFLSLIDRLTVMHMRVLDVVNGPRKWFRLVRAESPNAIHREGATDMYAYPTELVLPGFQARKALYKQVLQDLHAYGLVLSSDIKCVSALRKNSQSYNRFSLGQESGATPLGIEFVRFISDPALVTEVETSGATDD